MAKHGNTPAAWTAVTIIIAGSMLSGVAIVMGEQMLAYAGGGVVLVGAVVGKVMQLAGMGKRF